MNKKHKVRLTIRVTSQTAYNLDRLARMSGLSVGQVVDKLTRDRMISLEENIMSRMKIDEAAKRKCIALLADGMSMAEAAAQADINLYTVKNQWRRWAEGFGIQVRRKPLSYIDLTDEERRDIADMMARGEAATRVAEKYGIGVTAIYNRWRSWAEEFGIQIPEERKKRSGTDETGKVRTYTKSEGPEKELEKKRRRAVHLKDQGWDDRKVSQDTGLPPREIALYWRMWAKTYGVALLPKVPATKLPDPRNGEVVTYYVDKNGKKIEK